MGVRLQERDKRVLAHIARHRITTPDVLSAVFFPSPDAAKKFVSRLDGSFIQSRPLYQRRVYYQLTPAAARQFGASEDSADPLGRQALPKAYGTLAFCCQGVTKRRLFTRAEFYEAFPEFVDVVPFDSNYYLDHDGKQARLTRIVVDLGGDYQRLVRKCREHIREGLELPALRDIIAEDLFAIAVVTAEDSKRQALIDAFTKQPLHAFVRVEVVPELAKTLPHSEGEE